MDQIKALTLQITYKMGSNFSRKGVWKGIINYPCLAYSRSVEEMVHTSKKWPIHETFLSSFTSSIWTDVLKSSLRYFCFGERKKKKKKTKKKALKIKNPNTKHYQNGQNYFNFVSHQYIYSQILFSKISFGVNHGWDLLF
jgi:hypothetical protein